jgi:ABC-type bacteriocin/lantibiotic exporter with double-glycine peptidase domain
VTTAALTLAAALALEVPFVAQQKDTCGAASLAMVLRYWDVPASHDEIARSLLRPQLQGIPGSQLEAFARDRGLTAIAYAGDLANLREYVAKGRPLIVAWRIGHDRYHNVVVVGTDPDSGDIVVNDPAEGAARRVAAGTFEKRWAGAGHWTLLVLPAPK